MEYAEILVVEDEIIVAKSIQRRLEGLGYRVQAVVASAEEAIQRVSDKQPDLVLMDIKLQGAIDGVQAAEHIQASYDIPVVYLTAYADEETLERAKVTQPFGYLLKPFEMSELRTTVEMALYKHQVQRKLRDNERWLAATLKSIGDGVITTDTHGCVTFMNPVAEALTGWQNAEARGESLLQVFQVVEPEAQQVSGKRMEETSSGESIASLENHSVLISRDGRETTIDRSGAPIVDDRGNVTGGVLVFHDIGERRNAEQILRQRNRDLELLNRASQAFISTLDLDQVLATVLDEVRRVLGVIACSAWLLDPKTGELVCRQVTDPQGDVVRGWRLTPGQGLAGWVAQHGESLNVPDALTEARHFKGVDRQTGLPLRSILTVPLRIKDKVVGVIQVVDTTVARFDSTDLRLLESLASTAAIAVENARLYEETDRLRIFNQNIVQSMQEGVLLKDAEGHITFVNPRCAELLGYTPDELEGRDWKTLVAPEYAPQVEGEAARRFQGQTRRYEIVLLTKMGERVPVIVSAHPMFDEISKEGDNGHFVGGLLVITDITERVRMEQALRESEERYRTLFEQANDAIFLEASDDRIVDVNHRACELLGYTRDELLKMKVADLQSPRLRGPAGRALKNEMERQGAPPYETVNLHRDGTWIPVEVSTSRIASEEGGLRLAIVRDIRERKRAEAERERLIAELKDALAKIKTLRGLIPICASCKKIRDDRGYWQQVEVYIRDHSEAEFSHGLCPDCARRLYPDLYEEE
jgi:PAS domain S-box-containing protein